MSSQLATGLFGTDLYLLGSGRARTGTFELGGPDEMSMDDFQQSLIQISNSSLGALDELVRAGKVRYIGSSTFPPSQIVEAQWVAERRGLARFRTEQPPYSILDRGIEREVLPICGRYGMGVIVWSPLSKGMLTGRYRKGQPTPDSIRAKFLPRQMSDERNLDAVEQLIPLAQEAGLSLVHMVLG
jgi:aryl-alcohol dehydrogenase (NADP+)